MSSKATAVLPVKRFDAAKQRLGVGIDEERRQALVAAMLQDVLEAVGAARMIERTIVVSGEPAAQQIAHDLGADAIEDPDDRGHPEAALLGIGEAQAAGASCVVLLPGRSWVRPGRAGRPERS